MNRILRKPMLALALGAAALPLAATVPLPTASAAAQAGDLDQVVKALRGIKTMTANFTQTDRNGQALSGKLTLKRPGKIRFQYQKGVPLLIVSDGKALTFVDYEVAQVQKYPVGNSPLGALLDPNRDVKRFGKLLSTGNDNVVSVEVRDPKRPEYGVITLMFTRASSAPGGLELAGWVAQDAQNVRTTVRLSNQKYGMSVSDNTFRYRDPR